MSELIHTENEPLYLRLTTESSSVYVERLTTGGAQLYIYIGNTIVGVRLDVESAGILAQWLQAGKGTQA